MHSLKAMAEKAAGDSLHNQIQNFIKTAKDAGHSKSVILTTIQSVWGLEKGEALDEYHN